MAEFLSRVETLFAPGTRMGSPTGLGSSAGAVEKARAAAPNARAEPQCCKNFRRSIFSRASCIETSSRKVPSACVLAPKLGLSARLSHPFHNLLGSQNPVCKELEVNQRGRVAVPPLGVPGSSGRILRNNDLETLFE